MVERTAHNGLVVGSNPTKPKNFKANLTILIENETQYKKLQNFKD